MANWFKELLMRLYLVDRPVASRQGDRRKEERRWSGAPGEARSPLKDPRRKRDRRKSQRRG